MNESSQASGWQPAKIGDLCLRTDTVDPRKRPHEPFLYVDVSAVSNESYRILGPQRILGSEAPSRARKQIRNGDVIFATVRPTLKRVALVPPELDNQVCSTGYCVLRANPAMLEPRYLYFFLLTEEMTGRVEALQKGATYPAISDSDLFGETVPLPSLLEQRAIARALRAVQEAKEARQRELALERERKAALMEFFFTHGTRGEPTKMTEIGELPDTWSAVRIGEIASDLGSGITPRGGEKTYFRTGIPLIRSQNVQMNGLSLNDVAYISLETHKAMSRSAVRPGDVLLNITGASIGRVTFVPDAVKVANVNQHVCRIRLIEKAVAQFVSHFLSTPQGQAQVMGSQFGTTRQGLNYGNVRALRIPLPPIEEQRTIANVLLACDRKIAALESEMNLIDELFHSLLEELMTGRLSAVPLIEQEAAS